MSADGTSTFVVELTPKGRGAVAVVLVAGPRAKHVIEHCFTPNTPWTNDGPTIGRILLGRWGGEDGEELVICPRSEEEFEIHCHGGAAAASGIVRQLVDRGCESRTWRHWLATASTLSEPGSPRRGNPGSSPSSIQNDCIATAARIALADAPTSRTAAVLLDQYHGALRKAIDDACSSLRTGDSSNALRIIEGILKYKDVGLHLTSPWQVVIAGPPNVGKSSLINPIAGYQRAIVSPIPGTTRDVVSITTAIQGWPVMLADTAGLRKTTDELEAAGIALADSAIQQADLVIMVSAASSVDTATEVVERQLPPIARMLRVTNKVDLVNEGTRAQIRSDTLRVSALTGQGISELIDAIATMLVPNPPPTGAAVPFTNAQLASLQAALEAIERGDIEAAIAALNP
jgi:tRNA modification GTPase